MRGRLVARLAGFVVLCCFVNQARGAPFTPGNLVVVRVGDGSATLTSQATAVFLDEYRTTPAARVQAIAVPVTIAGANRGLTLNGVNATEGYLTRSTDGRYLTLVGYDASVGTTSVSSTQPTGFGGSVDRVVARIDDQGTIDTTTRLTNAYGGDSVRSVATADGSQYWVSGTSRVAGDGANSGGVNLVSHGGSLATRLSNTLNNTQNIAIFGGQLYVSSLQTNFRAVNTVGTGLPTTAGQPITPFGGMDGPGRATYAFVLFDQDQNGIPDLLYVADERLNGLGGLHKWTSTDGMNWTLVGTFTHGTTGLRGLTGEVINGNAVLYATTATNLPQNAGNELVMLTDTGPSATFVVLATASANTTFRGVAFAPVPEPAALLLGGAVTLGLTVLGLGRRWQQKG